MTTDLFKDYRRNSHHNRLDTAKMIRATGKATNSRNPITAAITSFVSQLVDYDPKETCRTYTRCPGPSERYS